VQDAYGGENDIYKTLAPSQSKQYILPMRQRHQESEALIKKKLGTKFFNELYEMLELEIQNETDPEERKTIISEICKGKPELIEMCHKLEEIIFMQQTFSYD